MKIRTGFVSNSSSSSFVVLGFSIKKENNFSLKNFELEVIDKVLNIPFEDIPIGNNNYDREDYIYNLLYAADNSNSFIILSDTENGSPDDETIVLGIEIAEGDDSDFRGLDEEVESIIDKVKEAAKKLGFSDKKIKIFAGTKMS